MAGISAIQRILDNQLTSKFARSLKHSDLPEGWADNPEIVQLAEDAYKEAGTESPFFKAWFGNSKVVDEAGEPLEVYHGTMSKAFDTFDKDYIGSRFSFDDTGFFFDSNRNVAKSYARDEFNPKKVGHVIPAYIRANNPLIIDNKFLKKEGMGPLLKEQDPIEFWDNYQDFALDAAQNKNANGIIVDDNDTKMIVAYEPTDIKHATRNRGTFNPADPNIYKGLIPAVGAGGLLSLMGAEEAEAAPYQFPADKRGTVLYEPGLESPIVDPVDLLTAPIGVPTAALKAASMAAEPFISYGMDKIMGGLLSMFGDEEE